MNKHLKSFWTPRIAMLIVATTLLPLLASGAEPAAKDAAPTNQATDAVTDKLGPKMVLDDWDWIERDLSLQIEKDLNASVPRYKDGDSIQFTLLGGVTEKGQYNWSSTNYVLIVTKNDVEKKIDFNKLSFDDRLRSDANIRSELINLQAALQTRRTLIENEVAIPGMVVAQKGRGAPRIDYSKKPEPLENFEELLYYADPRALHEMGNRFMSGEGVQKDPTYAFLYYREAASSGNVFAMFNLGLLYFKGVGIAGNKTVALQLISTAANDGHSSAKEFLSKYKVSLSQKKKAQEEYAKQLNVYNQKALANADRYSKMLAAQPLLQQGRTTKRFDGTVLRRTTVKGSNNTNRRNR
jgi:hypothetical protein